MALKMLSGTKTITTIQEGSAFKERWAATPGDPWPDSASARMEFLDSGGGIIAEIAAVSVDSRYITFRSPYSEVAEVPNGAGFRCYLTDPADDVGEHNVRYGSVFRRENFFPNSPSEVSSYEPKRFVDTFQRPAGALGSKWINLLGRAKIHTGTGGLPNSVGPDFNFFQRYFTRYYVPFSGDSIELSISCRDKGSGRTFVAVSSNSDATSFLYLMFDSDETWGQPESITLGVGHGPDVGLIGFAPPSTFEDQTTPYNLNVPSGSVMNLKLRYDEATRELSCYNDDYTTKYTSWIDVNEEVPHGRGYRYFGIGGNSGLIDNGVQVSYIAAADAV